VWISALGHMRLADLREDHIRDVQAALRRINTPAEAEDRSELMRRLAAARATVKHLPGLRVSGRPLSQQTIARITAPLRTALGAEGREAGREPGSAPRRPCRVAEAAAVEGAEGGAVARGRAAPFPAMVATVAFTMDVHTEVAEELAEQAADALAAFIPSKARPEAAR
jgi:hypothetical protein